MSIVNDRKLDELAAFLRDDEHPTTFTFAEAQAWSAEYGWSRERPSIVIQGLEKRNFLMLNREPIRHFRTLSSNPHDRWIVSKTHGGGGGDSINGMAGREG